MASLYDAITVKGVLRPRLNKSFIKKEDVPENVAAVLTTENIVDENGLIVVDKKSPEANEVQEEEITPPKPGGLPRIDQQTEDVSENQGEDDPVPSETTTPPVVDDNTNQEEENDTTAGDRDPNKKQTPVAQAAPEESEPKTPHVPVFPPEDKISPKPSRATRTRQPVETEKFRSKVAQSNPGMGFPRKNGKTVDIFDLETPHTHVKHVGGHAVPLSAQSFNSKNDTQIVNRLKELGYEIFDFDQQEREEAMYNSRQGNSGGLLLEEDEVEEDIRLG